MDEFKAVFDDLEQKAKMAFKDFYEDWKNTTFYGKYGDDITEAKKELDKLYEKNLNSVALKFTALKTKMVDHLDQYMKSINTQFEDLTGLLLKKFESNLNYTKDLMQGKDVRKYKHPNIFNDNFYFCRNKAIHSSEFWLKVLSDFLIEANDINKNQWNDFKKESRAIINRLVEKTLVSKK
ncbi:MAG: hypothetical protein WCO58_00640 [bacterium]